MKFETVLLQLLFSACALVCLLVMGSMIIAKAPAVTASVSHAPVAAVMASRS
jgi:hypothetical protein